MDTLGYRCKFGVMTPSTNTVVQPEYDAMRFPGVTNHISRMHIPDDPVESDEDFNELIRRIDIALEEALDRVMTCRPDWLILGISAESIWGGGTEPAKLIAKRIRDRAGPIGITQAADALPAALSALGVKKTIALLTPYHPVAERHLREYIEAIGYTLVRARHLECRSPTEIAHVPEKALFEAAMALDGDDVDAIVQFGANLPMGRVAAQLEADLKKPVIAINTATYWHALRSMGIEDRKSGVGRLLENH